METTKRKESNMMTETAICRFCGQSFIRRRMRGNQRQHCDAKKCLRAQKVWQSPGKPVGFEGLPNDPSPYRADIDYHGKPMP